MSVDKLLEKIRKMKNPTILDLSYDPRVIPQSVRTRGPSEVEAFQLYSRELIEALQEIVPAIRLKVGSFALLGAYGMELLRETAKRARSRGFYVLLEIPQTSSVSAAELSADKWLHDSELCPSDGLIVDAYAGSDILKPYVKSLQTSGKTLFVILRTANRSASELQDLLTGTRLVHMAAADIVSELSKPMVTRSGYSNVCAMASATSADSLKNLRAKHPHMFLLVDGYDQPSGDGKKCSYAFDSLGRGAIVCAGEGITGAWRDEPEDQVRYISRAVDAAVRMRRNLTSHVKIL